MSYQAGDVRVLIAGRPVTLRLTLGALFEISERLCAASPQALSQSLRRLTTAQARVLLRCLHCAPPADISADTVTDDEVMRLLPDICRVFERSFGDAL